MNFVRIIFNLLRFDRANWKAVVLCVATALVFWIFNAFNKNYSTNIRFPILFEFDGERYVPAEHFPKTITVNVSGNGWDLFRRYAGLRSPQLIIPLERPAEVRKIIASTLVPVVASQIGNLKVNFVVTDTLYLHIDKRDVHRYKLKADISAVSFQEGYGRISPVVVLPDSVKLEGPESRLHAVIDSIVIPVNHKNVSENFREEVEVTFAGSEFVRRNPPIVQVMFEVAQVEIVNKKLKVEVDKNSIALDVDSVNANFQIPVSRKSDFDLQSKEIISRVSTRSMKKNGVALPRVLNVPSYAQLLRIDSIHSKGH
ncbi:hypothetical protein WSM22_18420 [Cytophagales bacterium WSM2-2]|nr:hypothetical protein WSM22_18420 [Cytophagales bacterium WSM2-2]